MIIIRNVMVNGELKKYEAVIQGEVGETGRYSVIVHDPDLVAGRRRGFLLKDDKPAPFAHIKVAVLTLE